MSEPQCVREFAEDKFTYDETKDDENSSGMSSTVEKIKSRFRDSLSDSDGEEGAHKGQSSSSSSSSDEEGPPVKTGDS